MSDIDDMAKKLGLDTKPNNHSSDPDRFQVALEGIASCATQCPCCEMHRRVAEKALGYTVEITTDRIG